ncbi:MAG: NGG1p interacting factor NIF3 [Deltaproteobacteria bacterium]
MKLSRLYNQVVAFGIDRDPRKIKPKNPFPDTALLFGSPDTEVKKILVGIDIDVADLLLAERIRNRQGLDLVMSHHPAGRAYAALSAVMQLQVDVLAKMGISAKVAQELLDERMREVERRIMPNNHMRAVDAARLLELPFMCAHTPADNHVYDFIKRLLDRKKPKTVQDIVDILMGIPEYRNSADYGMGPRIILGSPGREVGKVSVEMTGGTEGPKEVFDKMYKVGIRTLVCMHLSEEHFKTVKNADINAVIAGHISSDTIGLNLLLDRIERQAKERFQIIECSGFRRVRRSATGA